MEPTIIHFVRHGIVHNPKKIFYGRLPNHGLSDEGIQVVSRLIPFFCKKPIDQIFSSPLLRTRQTARILALGLGNTPIAISRYLIEVHSPYDGHPLSELDAMYWDIYSGTQPPFEQPIDIFNRTMQFISRTIKSNKGKETIAVTHADTIVFLSLWVKGFEVSFTSKSLIERKMIDLQFPAPASVTSLKWDDGKAMPTLEYHSLEGSS